MKTTNFFIQTQEEIIPATCSEYNEVLDLMKLIAYSVAEENGIEEFDVTFDKDEAKAGDKVLCRVIANS